MFEKSEIDIAMERCRERFVAVWKWPEGSVEDKEDMIARMHLLEELKIELRKMRRSST